MSNDNRSIKPSMLMGFFVVGIALGVVASSLPYAGTIILFFLFAVSALAVWVLNLKPKLIWVATLDIGLICGSLGKSTYWKWQQGSNDLIDLPVILMLALLAAVISGLTLFGVDLLPRMLGSGSNAAKNNKN